MTNPGIAEFYSGKDVFITGATGFLGKVLVEKLLRSCTDIGNIYILVRALKGKTSQQRWDDLTELPLFDLLRKETPEAFKKVVVLNGDASNNELGLKPEEYQMLANNVSVIFHAAATVRFNESLTSAVKLNTYGTLQVVNLALKMKKLKAFIHISTAYSNCKHLSVEEKMYPAPADWRQVIKVTENINQYDLDVLTEKYLDGLPNTYVFSKALAENIIWDMRDKIPVVIFRPTIVIATWKEPIIGWIDNFNGPVGMLIACAKGVVRTMLSDPDAMADFTLVDCAVKSMIVIGWKRAVSTDIDERELIINCASTHKNVTNREVHVLGIGLLKKSPLEEILWYPSVTIQKNKTWYRIQAVYKHLIPAIIVDTLLKMVGRKPLLLKIQIKIHMAVTALSYFLLRHWKFENENFIALIKEIPAKDQEAFDYNFFSLDPAEYFEGAIEGGKKYLLKENTCPVEDNVRRYLIKKYMYYVVMTSFRLGVLYALYTFYKSYESSEEN